MSERRHADHGVYVSSKAGKCMYKSSWELAYMKHLDASQAVESWRYEPFKIPYEYRSGRRRCYIPDFLVIYSDGRREVIEIKPTDYLSRGDVCTKAKAALAWCKQNNYIYKFQTEVDLAALGLVSKWLVPKNPAGVPAFMREKPIPRPHLAKGSGKTMKAVERMVAIGMGALPKPARSKKKKLRCTDPASVEVYYRREKADDDFV